ncbi:sensor histidine kinase [Blautia stercoris]|uniref:sensor histidine kinase n=1 Tax=Blautia stercoris TaxID=871664 RepID=UPI0040284D54
MGQNTYRLYMVKAMSGGKKSDKKVIWRRRNWKRLNQMLDEGIRGEFEESKYDESELSKVESKWKRFLQDSAMAKQNLETEKANIKGLISDISHQTKTPMANIKLYSELLSEQLEEDGMEAELLGQIQAQAQKLEFLIQALTKLSRLETNILEVVPVKSQVKPLLESAVEEIRKKAEKKEIQIKIEMDFEAEAVFDRKWTEEALYNLLDNAVKYSPAGSEVLISTKLYEMWCVIAVSDRGRGISEEEIPKIFGRFYRAKEVQQEEGVGIGLYLVREILQKEGGFIKVNSEVGKGSTFLCYLPR